MRAEREVELRIVVVAPPAGVMFGLQKGRHELASVALSTGADLSFEFSARVVARDEAGPPDWRGPFVQGPREARFVYVNSGTLAGDADSCWTRRAKIGLRGISWALVDQALAAEDGRLEVRIAGKSKDGGPACATIPLLDGGWRAGARAAQR